MEYNVNKDRILQLRYKDKTIMIPFSSISTINKYEKICLLITNDGSDYQLPLSAYEIIRKHFNLKLNLDLTSYKER